jgi:hypothetical protein
MSPPNPFFLLAQRVRHGDERATAQLRSLITGVLQRLVRCALTVPALDTRFARAMRQQSKALVERSDVLFSLEAMSQVLARRQCDRLIATLQPSNTPTRTFEDTWCEILHPRKEKPCTRPSPGA